MIFGRGSINFIFIFNQVSESHGYSPEEIINAVQAEAISTGHMVLKIRRSSKCLPDLSFSCLQALWLAVVLTLAELLKRGFLNFEAVEQGVLLEKGEPTPPILCALLVPFDSSQARSFASMSTLACGVPCLCTGKTKFEI